jgi:hypothetical protein
MEKCILKRQEKIFSIFSHYLINYITGFTFSFFALTYAFFYLWVNVRFSYTSKFNVARFFPNKFYNPIQHLSEPPKPKLL